MNRNQASKIVSCFRKRRLNQAMLKCFLILAVFCCILLTPGSKAAAGTAHNVDEAINWCYSQLGKSIDTDGYPSGQPYQCVDLIRAYYQYLGVSAVSGNGADYAWNDLPSGWTRVQGGTPQRGDILVYSASSSNQYGHVAIYESDRSTFHQNFDGYTHVVRATYMYNGLSNPYWGYIRPNFVSTVTLDVNGCLDGENSGGIEGYGTFDVYLNGSKIADDVSDYYNVNLAPNTTYSITDIRATDGHSYEGVKSGSLSGTLTGSGSWVQLSFTTHGTLSITGLVDSAAADDVNGYGTYDVYINGEAAAEGVSAYSAKWPQGTTYEIRNIHATDGKYYNGATSGALNGKIGKGTTAVTLSFHTKLEPGVDWREVDTLPDYIDPSVCEIEYSNHYSTTAAVSPGVDWVRGAGTTVYEKSGGEYEVDFDQGSSNTHRQVRYFYYHWCGPNTGNMANYAPTSSYVHYDSVDAGSVYVTNSGADGENPAYTWYTLNWNGGGEVYCQGGVTCDGSFGLHGQRSRAWYRKYVYQDYVEKTIYEWTKDSGWTDSPDESADSVTCRFRLKQYAVIFNANGGENAPENMVKYHGVDLKIPDAVPTMALYSFTGWNTEADGKGTDYPMESIIILDADVTLFAQWSPLTKMILPEGLKSIEEEAFAGIGAAVIYVPDGCESIGIRAFADSPSLRYLYIPASVKNISFDAFDGCDMLTVCAPEGSTAIRLSILLGIPYELTE